MRHDSIHDHSRRVAGVTRLLLTICLLPVFTVGCAFSNPWRANRPFAPYSPCALGGDATLEQVVAKINENTALMPAWTSNRCRLSPKGLSAVAGSVSASIAVAAPRNFRLRASGPGGPVVDIGSNTDEFWFWSQYDQEPGVKVCSHSDAELATRRMPVPLQPDWVMEALGVTQLDASGLTFEPIPSTHSRWLGGQSRANLVSYYTASNGAVIRKVIVVDTCQGTILRHELKHGETTLARAEMRDHRRCPRTGAIYPAAVDLHWPASGVALTMQFDSVDIAPTGTNPVIFDRPEIPNTPVIDLAAEARRRSNGFANTGHMNSSGQTSGSGQFPPRSGMPADDDQREVMNVSDEAEYDADVSNGEIDDSSDSEIMNGPGQRSQPSRRLSDE